MSKVFSSGGLIERTCAKFCRCTCQAFSSGGLFPRVWAKSNDCLRQVIASGSLARSVYDNPFRAGLVCLLCGGMMVAAEEHWQAECHLQKTNDQVLTDINSGYHGPMYLGMPQPAYLSGAATASG